MNQEIRLENKKEDKKFLGKFLIILLCSFLIGIVAGFGMAFVKDATELPTIISESIHNVMMLISPYVSVVFVVVMGTALFLTHKKASAMAKAWDGEDEEEYQKIDDMLGNVLYALNIGTVVTYFFFAIGFEDIVERSKFADACYLLGFVAALVVIIVGQSAIIKLTKEMNPEKKGSVYDTKFLDKWEDSCDEAEKILIYKSAYKTYTKMSTLFIGLWIFCVFGNSIFHFGLMPVTMVSLIWLCQVCLYTHYSKYYSKHPEKIGVFK